MANKKEETAEMPKGDCCAVAGITGQMLALGIVLLILGILVGSMLSPILYGNVLPEEEPPFVLDEAKAAKIITVMEKLALVNTGEEGEIILQGVEELELLKFKFLYNGQETVIYVSEDYQKILGAESAQNVEELNTALDQLIETYGLGGGSAGGESDTQSKTETPKVELYIMSNCPAGNAAEDNLLEVITILGDKIEFEPVYIISDYGNGNYGSLHGTYELNQDIREKIIYNMYGAQKWIEYVVSVNADCDEDTMEECWKTVAEEKEINVTAVENAYAEQFGEIASADAEKTDENSITASPTLIVNGEKIKGAKSGSSYLTLICNGFLEAPEECGETVTGNSSASGSCGNS